MTAAEILASEILAEMIRESGWRANGSATGSYIVGTLVKDDERVNVVIKVEYAERVT